MVIDEIKQKSEDADSFKVKLKLIDANHCPGSSMILVSGPHGTILHTGDVRYNFGKMLKDIGLLV